MSEHNEFSFEQDFLNHTGNIGSTTLFSPSADTSFVFTLGVVSISGGGTTAEIDWTDPGSNSQLKSAGSPIVFAAVVKGGTNVTVTTSGSSGTYSLYITATKVGVS